MIAAFAVRRNHGSGVFAAGGFFYNGAVVESITYQCLISGGGLPSALEFGDHALLTRLQFSPILTYEDCDDERTFPSMLAP
jgi:hypothetical protein